MSPHLFTQTLTSCIADSISLETQEFQWDKFFRLWFRENGTPYFFLFKRHLGVTNTQYVELLSLIQVHSIEDVSNDSAPKLLFHTTEQMKSMVTDPINSLIELPETERKSYIEDFAEKYGAIFASSVAIDMLYCSCAVFLPPSINLNLQQVCADAGYIHSAGRSVYIRNIRKARRKDFESSISQYLDRVSLDDLPITFIVYAHEDFTSYDRSSRDQIERGIGTLKLHLEKMNMGGYGLSQIVHEMRERFDHRLSIPEAGPYTQSHKFKHRRTLWLICDYSVSSNDPRTQGRDRYYICYEQITKNDSPFFFFDENKPGWKSHTTLPHSLTAALINSTRSHQKDGRLCDPFGGTGTTWFEAKRLALNTSVQCSDTSVSLIQIVKDNLHFFLMGHQELTILVQQLQEIGKLVKEGGEALEVGRGQGAFDFGPTHENGIDGESYISAVELLNELRRDQPQEDQEYSFNPEFIDRLANLPFISRFLFYVVLRAQLRYQGGYRRQSITFSKAFESSLNELVGQIEHLLGVRNSVENSEHFEKENFVTYNDTYSSAVFSKFFLMPYGELLSTLNAEVLIKDACDLIPNSLDVIICDPPYGFNTSEDQASLSQLYSSFLEAAINALREKGHLIICLPAESYTGKDLAYCTKSDLIVNQVLAKAHILKKEVYSPARNVPSRIFTPPYYWEAERALRRVILHFRIGSA